ncbi:MAG: two-component regulator propeller domain-containing protein [candidate division KSB1 bacterium]|nr:two-component regulator propeller domain-containing protein [candidate division KSB1 bacterium]
MVFTSGLAQYNPSNLQFYQIDTEDGLSDNTITAIQKGPDGFMWFGTTSGLNKYNGYDIQIYPARTDSLSLSDSWITDIEIDASGNLWIGTQNGVNRYIPEYDGFEHHLKGIYIHKLAVLRGEQLAVCTHSGLALYNAEQNDFRLFEHDPENGNSINNNTVMDIISLCNGDILIATADQTIQRFDPVNKRFTSALDFQGLPHSRYEKYLFQDTSGCIWVGTDAHGVIRYQPKDSSFVDYTGNPAKDLSCDFIQIQSYLFVGTEGGGGLQCFNLDAKAFSTILPDPKDQFSLSNGDVFSLYYDRVSQILWVGTLSGGVNVHDPRRKKFDLIKNNPYDSTSLSPNPVASIFQDSKNRLWMGTDHGGLCLYRGPEQGFRHYTTANSALSSDAVMDVEEAPDGRILISTWGGGVNVFNPERGHFTRFMENPADDRSLLSNNVADMYVDQQSRIWLTVSKPGAARFEYESGSFQPLAGYLELPDYLQAIGSDANGDVWMTGQRQGVWIYQPDRQQVHPIGHFTDDSLSVSVLKGGNQIYRSDSNDIWIPAENGLFRIHPHTKNTIKRYTREDGLPGNSVASIIQDHKGLYWLGTSHGLSRFDLSTGEFVNFDLSDGLQGYQFESGLACKDSSGYLYFGGSKGYNRFHPDNIAYNRTPPPIVFTDFKLFNESVNFGNENSPLSRHINETKRIELNDTQKVLTFEFAALNFTNPSQNKYACKLTGFDETWIQLGHKRTVTYTNLDPGDYTFSVKAANNDGIWNETGRRVELEIIPPFWQTALFRITGLFAGLALILFLIRHRTRTIRARNLRLEEMVAERTRELQVSKQALQQSRDDLEDRVRERTAELTELKKSLEQKVEQSTKELQKRVQESEKSQKAMLYMVEDLNRIASELKTERRKLEFSNQELESFAYSVSHDLRAPLRAMDGFSRALLEDYQDKLDEQGRDYARRVRDASQRMGHLIDDLLQLSRASRYKMSPKTIDFSKMVRDEYERLKTAEPDRNVKLICADGMSAYGDVHLLSLVIQNLLGNAWKFTKKTKQACIEFSAQSNFKCKAPNAEIDEEELVYFVRDNGAGFDQDYIDKLFQPFQRLHTDNEFPGTGIGLATVQRIIRRHNGSVWAQGGVGKGAVFYFTLFEKKNKNPRGMTCGKKEYCWLRMTKMTCC